MTKYDVDAIRRSYPLHAIVAARAPSVNLRQTASKREWEGLCPFHSEKTPSFQIFIGDSGTEIYHCKGCGTHGDVIDFVREYDSVDFRTACERLTGGDIGNAGQRENIPATPPADPYLGWEFSLPPSDTRAVFPGKTVYVFNPKRAENPEEALKPSAQRPSMVFPYRDRSGTLVAYVLRMDIPGKHKIIMPIRWAVGPHGETGWCCAKWADGDPRPIYGQEFLSDDPRQQIFIVEGEKSADALRRIFSESGKSTPVITWIGGSKAAKHTDWTWAKDRKFVIWPDADQPGIDMLFGWEASGKHNFGLADILKHAGASEIKYFDWDRTKPEGWDAANAESEGMALQDILSWAKPRVRTYEAPPQKTSSPPQEKVKKENVISMPKPKPTLVQSWQDELLLTEKNMPKPKSLHNMILYLKHHEAFKGVFRWNDFSKRVFICNRPPWEDKSQGQFYEREMVESDIIYCMTELEKMYFQSDKKAIMQDAIYAAAIANSYNPAQEYLEGLKWDGTRRLGGYGDGSRGWVQTYLKAEDSELSSVFGAKWLISGVARILSPGCKADSILILEGSQGKKKSTALKTIANFHGENLYTDEMADFGNKDAAMQLQGVVIIELAELDCLDKVHVNRAKAFIARGCDRYRPPFGRLVASFPRTSIMAGTVNPDGMGYLDDATGNRRYWPVMCDDIDITALTKDRDQLWAEACARYHDGEQWWLTQDQEKEARKIQKSRYRDDVWAETIDEIIEHLPETTTREILLALGVETSKQTMRELQRVGKHLTSRGWVRRQVREGDSVFRRYFPPEKEGK